MSNLPDTSSQSATNAATNAVKKRTQNGDITTATSDTSADSPGQIAPGGGVIDRRVGIDRRNLQSAEDDVTGLERRRGRGRRRGDFREAAEEGEMTKEQFLFLMAINGFKQANNKQFPTWSDVLEVVRLLGYRKTAASELKLPSAEDWRERPDADSGVRPDGWERRFSKAEKKSLDLAAIDSADDDSEVPDIDELRDLERDLQDEFGEAA